MKTFLYVGGPLILFTWFCFHSDLITFGDQQPGMIHFGGVEQGGTFALRHEETYQCDENGDNCVLIDEKTEVSEVEEPQPSSGVSASANYRLEEQSTGFADISGFEIEQEPIEYRDGVSKQYNKTKQPGLTKYANITMKRPTGFDWKSFRFEFQR